MPILLPRPPLLVGLLLMSLLQTSVMHAVTVCHYHYLEAVQVQAHPAQVQMQVQMQMQIR